MADNTDLDAGTGGDKIVTREISHGGDTAKLQGVFAMGISGTEGAYTAAAIGGDATNGLDVDVTRSALPTGAATSAKQDTAQTSLDAIAASVAGTLTVGSHAVTNAGTFATQESGAALTSLQLLDDTVYAEDVPAQAADKGIAVLAVRRDADTSLVGADNDYANLQVNAAGSLKVAITSGAGSGTSIADGATFTRDTTSITPAGAAVESSAPTLTNGDVAALSMTTGGALRVAVASGGVAGVSEDAAAAGGEEGIQMLAVRRDSASSGVSADGDFAALSVTSDGSLRAAVSNTVTVASHAVTNAGTFAVQESGSALTALQLIDDPVFADDAAYTLSTSKASVVAGIAVETDGTDPTTVSAEGDAAALRTDRARRLLVSEMHPRSFFTSADYASAQTNTSVQGAPGAGLSLYITDIVISNGATAGNITLLDGSGGTVKFEIYPAINGGVSISLRNPIRLTANTALCITSTTVTTHSVNIGGYIAP